MQVVYTGDALEEPVLVIALAAEMARDERIERGSEHIEALGLRREGPAADPDTLFAIAKAADVGGLLAGTAFQIRVLPWCRRILARFHNADARAS